MTAPPKLDITLVSGARPALLAPTLASFSNRIFRHFDIGTCYANIDLFGGSKDDRRQCLAIIQDYFPTAKVTVPDQPSFGQAVKTIWSQVTSPFALHMEDDWEVLEDITPERVFPLFDNDIKLVKLVSKELGWNGVDLYYERARKTKLFGLILWKSRRKMSVFGTSPGFFAADFVRTAASLMNPTFDPEKQMRPKVNAPLFRYVSQFRCRLLPGTVEPDIIRDTGRDWRQTRGLKKTVSAGKSSWS